MKKSLSNSASGAIRIGSFRWQTWPQTTCTVGCQVNLLSVLILAALGFGLITGIFKELDRFEIIMLTLSVVGLISVFFLNHARKTELSAILFYCALNLISLVTFQLFEASPVETVLTYVFLLALIIFLFQTFVTRIVSMLIVIVRITIYALNIRSIGSSTKGTLYTANPTPHFAYDALLLFLLVLVFGFYGWRMYVSENNNSQKTLFGQHMSHDLQVSFKSLSSTIGIFKHSFESNASADPVLIDEVVDASKFYAYILSNFLDFSRAENAQIQDNHLEPIDLEGELETLVDLYKYSANEKGVQIRLEVDDQLPTLILSDKVKIIRIVLNLLSNAIKNTHHGKMIVVSVKWLDGEWQLTVANDGNPIEDEEIRKMFSPYEPSETGNPRKRLGLGLPITKHLVDALGGTISASSQEGKPTTFIIAFPKTYT